MVLAQAFAPLVDLIYPPRCPLCGEAIAAQTGLCIQCWGRLELPNAPGADDVIAATLYNDASRDLVLALKYGRRLALAPMLARLMAARVGDLEGEWLLVPVPLHRWRMWHRGFNQSALLANELGALIQMPVVVDGLVRRKSTRSLGGLGARARREELTGAIAVNSRRANRLRGANVMLIDDVLTSGATSETCMTALIAGGASKVRLACFARKADL